MGFKTLGAEHRGFSRLGGAAVGFKALPMKLNRLMLLNSIWAKEAGTMAAHWELYGVKGSSVFVKTRSSAAWQELTFKSAALIRSLNKYFDRPWIKEIKKAV